MRRVFFVLEICFVFTFSIFLYVFTWAINFTKSQTVEQIKRFSDMGLVDANNEVNLSELESIRDDTYKKFKSIFEDGDVQVLNQKIENIEKQNVVMSSEIEKIAGDNNQLEEELETLKKQYQTLNDQYQKQENERRMAQIQSQTNYASNSGSYFIQNFPTINQYPNYPTGCESVALTLLLRFHGVSVSVDDVISRLKKEPLPYYEGNVLYGGSPYVGFVGNPYVSKSYGVYEQPIAEVASSYKGNVISKSGVPFSEVLSLISQGKPVMVWTSMGLAVPYISASWVYKPTGETIRWKAQEHAVVIIGYNDNSVIISDPIQGMIKYQSRTVFESRYQYYGSRVVYYD